MEAELPCRAQNPYVWYHIRSLDNLYVRVRETFFLLVPTPSVSFEPLKTLIFANGWDVVLFIEIMQPANFMKRILAPHGQQARMVSSRWQRGNLGSIVGAIAFFFFVFWSHFAFVFLLFGFSRSRHVSQQSTDFIHMSGG